MSQMVFGCGRKYRILLTKGWCSVYLILQLFADFFFLFLITLFFKIVNIVHVSCTKCKQFWNAWSKMKNKKILLWTLVPVLRKKCCCCCCCCCVTSVVSDSVGPQRRQPTRLPRPWDSPGESTGVGATAFFFGKNTNGFMCTFQTLFFSVHK